MNGGNVHQTGSTLISFDWGKIIIRQLHMTGIKFWPNEELKKTCTFGFMQFFKITYKNYVYRKMKNEVFRNMPGPLSVAITSKHVC